MEFRRYWEIVLRYKALIISMILCASLGALAATYLLSETYVASALVLIRPQDTRRVTDPPAGMKEKEVLGFPLVGTQAKIFNRSYAEIIQSRDVAKQIVDDLGLDKLPKPVEPNLLKRAWKFSKDKAKFLLHVTWNLMKHGRFVSPDPYENLIDAINGSISAGEVRDTYLVQIDMRSNDPDFGALIANSAAKVFVNHWRKAYYRETGKDLAILEDQLDLNNAELNAHLNA
ncbi:Wzz/FepE/Etk N-terminal domain-containing protein, partial [Thermodesulfobacteriota bacterium]